MQLLSINTAMQT